MKKIAIIYRVDINNPVHRAVKSMQDGNADSWEKLGYQVTKYFLADSIWMENDQPTFINATSTLGKLNYLNNLRPMIHQHQFDVIIIMHTAMSFGLKKFCSIIKASHPNTKIILELQTYPYIYEYSKPKRWIALLLQPKNLKGYVDWITHLGPEKVIWNIPTIQAINAIDPSKLKAKLQFPPFTNTLKILVVCNFWSWHNYPQLIEALHRRELSNPEIIIELTFVGSGPTKENLIALINSLNLQNRVKLLDRMPENELIDLVNEHHLGLGNIAVSLQNKGYCQSLKHRFYAASGLPFILNTRDPFFFDQKFCCFIDQGIIDDKFLNQVVEWFLANYHSLSMLSSEMRAYAEKDLTWDKNVSNIKAAIEKKD
jgi:glycosyltransferase involved in cell wall biosynthesis